MSISLDLDEEQIAALQLLSDNLPPNLRCLVPIIESIREGYSDVPPHKRPLPTRPATDFEGTVAAAKALGVDYNPNDASYIFNLESENPQVPRKLSDNFASVIKTLKTSEYVTARQDESFCRTVLDLIIADRLLQLQDRDAHCRLQVATEVPVSIRIKDIYGNEEMVKGRADWALGYGPNKTNTGTVLLVVEAKPHDSASIGMPQLLVYMAAVHNARATRMNRSVFGMLSDGQDFRFAFLNEEKKFFTSLPFLWAPQQSTIITYIDTMLIDAIESSPHTTLQKRNNRTLCRYSQYLGRQWKFGDESDDEGAEGEEQQEEDDDDDEDDGMVDVVNIGGRVTLRFRRRLSFTG